MYLRYRNTAFAESSSISPIKVIASDASMTEIKGELQAGDSAWACDKEGV